MSELRKANTDRPFFFTCTFIGWIDIFTRSEYAEIIIDSLNFCVENKGLHIYTYVIMSNHIHIIARQDDGKLNEVIRDFKSFTAKQIIQAVENNTGESRKEWILYLFGFFAKKYKQNTKYIIWKKTTHPLELFSNEIIDQKVEYIHNNPVKAGILNEASEYTYSCANLFSKIKTEEI